MYNEIEDITSGWGYGAEGSGDMQYNQAAQPVTQVGPAAGTPTEAHGPTIAWGALVLAAVLLAVLENVATPGEGG